MFKILDLIWRLTAKITFTVCAKTKHFFVNSVNDASLLLTEPVSLTGWANTKNTSLEFIDYSLILKKCMQFQT